MRSGQAVQPSDETEQAKCGCFGFKFFNKSRGYQSVTPAESKPAEPVVKKQSTWQWPWKKNKDLETVRAIESKFNLPKVR